MGRLQVKERIDRIYRWTMTCMIGTSSGMLAAAAFPAEEGLSVSQIVFDVLLVIFLISFFEVIDGMLSRLAQGD